MRPEFRLIAVLAFALVGSVTKAQNLEQSGDVEVGLRDWRRWFIRLWREPRRFPVKLR